LSLGNFTKLEKTEQFCAPYSNITTEYLKTEKEFLSLCNKTCACLAIYRSKEGKHRVITYTQTLDLVKFWKKTNSMN